MEHARDKTGGAVHRVSTDGLTYCGLRSWGPRWEPAGYAPVTCGPCEGIVARELRRIEESIARAEERTRERIARYAAGRTA